MPRQIFDPDTVCMETDKLPPKYISLFKSKQPGIVLYRELILKVSLGVFWHLPCQILIW